MINCLVTGGAGFIGANLVRKLNQRNDRKIIILDALTYAGNVERIGDLIETRRVSLIKGSITDRQFLKDSFRRYQFDEVIHLAAESHVDRSILAPQTFIETNVMGTFQLLETARVYWKGCQNNRFIHVSTDEVFGSLPLDSPPFDETSPYDPKSPYSASKASSDHLVRSWVNTYDFPAIITNCSNNYGPWQYPEKLIPLTICNAIDQLPIFVYGRGNQIRDWIHVDDHCEAIILALTKGNVGESYLFGGNSERTNLDVVEKICDEVDRLLCRREFCSKKLIKMVKDRPGHDFRYALSNKRAAKTLRWTPRFDFEKGLKETIAWYLRNKRWCDRLRDRQYQDYFKKQYRPRVITGSTAREGIAL